MKQVSIVSSMAELEAWLVRDQQLSKCEWDLSLKVQTENKGLRHYYKCSLRKRPGFKRCQAQVCVVLPSDEATNKENTASIKIYRNGESHLHEAANDDDDNMDIEQQPEAEDAQNLQDLNTIKEEPCTILATPKQEPKEVADTSTASKTVSFSKNKTQDAYVHRQTYSDMAAFRRWLMKHNTDSAAKWISHHKSTAENGETKLNYSCGFRKHDADPTKRCIARMYALEPGGGGSVRVYFKGNHSHQHVPPKPRPAHSAAPKLLAKAKQTIKKPTAPPSPPPQAKSRASPVAAKKNGIKRTYEYLTNFTNMKTFTQWIIHEENKKNDNNFVHSFTKKAPESSYKHFYFCHYHVNNRFKFCPMGLYALENRHGAVQVFTSNNGHSHHSDDKHAEQEDKSKKFVRHSVAPALSTCSSGSGGGSSQQQKCSQPTNNRHSFVATRSLKHLFGESSVKEEEDDDDDDEDEEILDESRHEQEQKPPQERSQRRRLSGVAPPSTVAPPSEKKQQPLQQAAVAVRLDVGGEVFSTFEATLKKLPMFSNGFMSSNAVAYDNSRQLYVLDRDKDMFRYVLGYLRTDQVYLPDKFNEYERLMAEARHFELEDMHRKLTEHMLLKTVR